MDIIWSTKADSILRVGLSLLDSGIRNWALTRAQALTVLNSFANERIAVLGGDVVELNGNAFQLNYDNWYCNRLPDETSGAFVERSLFKARAYIENYGISPNKEMMFTIVPDV